MSIWDVRLDKLQDSRLLALRMHVARYLVRTGAIQRTAVAVVDDAHRGVMLELLEAAGAREPQTVTAGQPVPSADVILVALRAVQGEAALPLDPLAAPTPTQIWAIDLERIAVSDERIVESVETLIRIVMPEALGANGTPPAEDVAVRIR